jgi:hypothetical protein
MFQHLEAIHIRKSEVQDYKIRWFGIDYMQTILATFYVIYDVTVLAQNTLQAGSQGQIIFDQQ